MNAEEITRVLTRFCGDTFRGVYARDRLPSSVTGKPALFVVNTDTATKSGEHWIVMYFDADGTAEYFDSLAEYPLKTFENYLNKHSKHWVANEKQLQSIISRFCGSHVVLYSLFRCKGYDLIRYGKLFTTDVGFNDVIAHGLICSLVNS